MKKLLLGIIISFVLHTSAVYAQNVVSVSEGGADGPNFIYLKNGQVVLGFDLGSGFYFVKDSKNQKVIDYAYFQAGGLQSKDACEKRTWSSEDISDALGKGKALTIKVAFENYADTLWQVRLYEGKSFLIFNMGVHNDTASPYQLTYFAPLISKRVFQGMDNSANYRVLDGNGGGSPTWVTESNKLNSFNNLLVKFGPIEQPNILVAGGVSYHEFEKFVRVARGNKVMQLYLYSEDPVGRRIDAGQQYWLDEKYYLSVENENPFVALEQYSDVLKTEQSIAINYYDFLTECLWYAAFYNNTKGREKFNNTKGAVEEMENAIKSGITNYTKVAIRLVPDAYGPNNQQGWWDDEHWSKYNEGMSTVAPHYTEPYLTTESWCKAIIDKGGYPFTYMQAGRRSEDFAQKHPDWMLFNDPYRPYIGAKRLLQEDSYNNAYGEEYARQWWLDKHLWSYDFTDPGFIEHMKGVYANLKKAGIKGIFYDYPETTAWAYEGGFENKYATTAWAYRQVFQLARDGLGKNALFQERNVIRGSDITLGLVDSQRVWADTDGITPEMISRCGLRWYKNRKIISYDMDSKDPLKAQPTDSRDGNRSMLTMCYVTSARFLLGRSLSQLSPEQLHDLSRTFPYHSTSLSARPIDAFDKGVKFPRIYDFPISADWHQLAFYNQDAKTAATIGVALGKSLNEGGLGLDAGKQYYSYDFWNDAFVGLISGSDKLEQNLRPGESRMISLHAKANHPQFISTNRHILQGYLDLKDCRWNSTSNTLEGKSEVIGGDSYKIVIARNGYKAVSCTASNSKASLQPVTSNGDLVELTIEADKNASVSWSVKFAN